MPDAAPAETGDWQASPTGEELARRILLLSALGKRVEEERDALKAEIRARRLLAPGHTIHPRLADGEAAGRVTFSTGTVRAKITDPAALAQWCVTYGYRDVVTYRPVVAEDFVAKLLEMSKAAEQPIGPGGEVGEDGPKGVAVMITGGTLSATPDPDRADALWSEIRSALHTIPGATPILEELQ